MRALLLPRFDSVQISHGPEELAQPSLLLLIHGWGTLEPFAALRQCQLQFAAPVVAVVSQRRGSQISDFLRAGAVDCVRWPGPGADAELLARVEVRVTSPPLDVRLDPGALTLTCRDVHARLTPTEFKIVHYLLANSARWSASDEMTTAALRSARASENLLRVHIYSVRRKLKHEAWRILTNRNFGYRFDISSSRADPQVDESHAVE
jgi:DNA-binding response OmpR family regulator